MNERIKQLVMKSGASRHDARYGGQFFSDEALEKLVKLLLEEAVSELHGVRTKISDENPSRVLDLAVNRVRAIDHVPPPKPKKPSPPKPKKPKKAKPLKITPPQVTTPVTTKSTSPGGWSNLFTFSTLGGIGLM